jgi:hypothetical protein
MIAHTKRTHKHFFTYMFILGTAILIVFTYLYWTASLQVTSKIGNYIQILTLVIFTVTGLITVQTFKHQTDDRNRMIGIQYANMTQGTIADIDKIFMSNRLLDRLYFEMYSHDPHIKKIIKMMGKINVTPEILKLEHQTSNLIFQKIADIFACEKLDHTDVDCIEWINTFRGWMKSPILRSHWQYLKYEQHPDVRQFVDEFFIKKNKFIQSRNRNQKQSQVKIGSQVQAQAQAQAQVQDQNYLTS